NNSNSASRRLIALLLYSPSNSQLWRDDSSFGIRQNTTAELAVFAYWGWQNRLIMQQVFAALGTIRLMSFCLLLTLGVILSALSFTILVRSMGYPFTYRDGYHSLNLSQIAAMVPGKIWGFAGLAGLLSARGIPSRDSVLVIALHTLLTLSAA